jgi:hypothetical protein
MISKVTGGVLRSLAIAHLMPFNASVVFLLFILEIVMKSINGRVRWW